MKLRKIPVFTAAMFGLATGSALAIPLSNGGTVGASNLNPTLQQAAMVCDAWGRCWRTAPYYGGGGYYGGYGGYGGYRGYGGYNGNYGGGWNRGWGGGGWGHRDWDGRDWHGGRWGHDD